MSHLFHTSLMYTFNLWRQVIAPMKNVWEEQILVNAHLQDRGSSFPPRHPSFCTHLPDLLANDGEHPEVENVFCDGGTGRRRPLEVHQQHVGEQQEEEEVHENVAQKRGDGREPELSPSWYDEGPLGWALWLWDACGVVGKRLPRGTLLIRFREEDESPLMVAPLGELDPCASASLQVHIVNWSAQN